MTRLHLALAALLLFAACHTARPYLTPDSAGIAWDNIGGIDIIAGQPAPFICGLNVDC